MDITWFIIVLLALMSGFMLWSEHKSRKEQHLERNRMAQQDG